MVEVLNVSNRTFLMVYLVPPCVLCSLKTCNMLFNCSSVWFVLTAITSRARCQITQRRCLLAGHRFLLTLFGLLLCVQETIKLSHTLFAFMLCLCGRFMSWHSPLDHLMHTLSNNSSLLQAKVLQVNPACNMLPVGLLPFPPWGSAVAA